jgi:hypothetical protein
MLRFRKIAKGDCWPHHICPFVCPHGKALLPLEEFSRNLIFEYFSEICQEGLTFIKILQE